MGTPHLRESTDDDVEAMIAVTGAHWQATTGLTHPMNVERLRAVRTFPGRDPGRDSPVVELDGRVVAWGSFFAFPPYSQVFMATAVSPDLDDADHDTCVGLLVDHATRNGGDRLAAAGIPLDPERRLATDAVHADTRTIAALERHGFAFERHELEMAIDLTAVDVVLAPLPDSVTVRPAHAVDDALIVAAVLREAFLDHHGDTPFTDEVVSESLREEARAGATLLAEDSEGPVGAIISRDRGEGGYVWAVGVLRRGRRHGLAAALLTRAFADFAAGGRTLVTLDVDAESLTGATRVYERLGMSTRVVLDEYVRSLAHGPRT
jgi:ribosomal protein S18 acetylase RimI-like enzyme